MKRPLMLLLLALVISTNAIAQSITGTVKDANGIPLPYTTIKVMTLKDSLTIVGGITDPNGHYSLEITGHTLPLLVKASLIGYTPKTLRCEELIGNDFVLEESSTLLNEVSITANRIPHKLVPGGLSTSIENSPLARLNDIYSVLRGIPLIEVQGESIKVAGKGSPIIYINDRLMTNEMELHNLKPHLIKSIEVITNPGAKYRASTQCILKIYTRREPGMGLSLDIGERLTKVEQRPMSPSSWLHTNYRVNRWDFFTGLFYSGNYWRSNSSFNKNIAQTPDSKWINIIDLMSMGHNQYFEITTGINYEDEIWSTGIKYIYSKNKSNSTMISKSSMTLNQGPSIRYDMLSNTASPWTNTHHPSLYYIRHFDDWKVQLDMDYYAGKSEEYTDIRENNYADNTEREIHNSKGEKSHAFGIRAEAIGKVWGGQLTLGGEYTNTHNEYFVLNDRQLVVPDVTTTQKEDITALFAEYARPVTKKWLLSLGTRFEYYYSANINEHERNKDIIYQKPNIFPTLSLGGEIGGVNTQLSFRSNITRPRYWELTPQYQYISMNQYQVGDPSLKPSINYQTQLMVNKNWFTFMADYSYVVNDLTQQTELMPDPKDPSKYIPYTTLLRNINAHPYHNVSAIFVASPTIKWWHPTFQIMISKLIGCDVWDLDKHITNRKPTLIVAINNMFTLPYDMQLYCNVKYIPFASLPTMAIERGNLDTWAELSKSWLKEKNLITSISATNFIPTNQRIVAYSRYTRLNSENQPIMTMQFTITYRFNQTKNKYQGKGALNSVTNRM